LLESIGITGTATRIYTELVKTGGLTTAEVAARCGVPARRAASELASLVSLGLALRFTGRPASYRAVAPDVAISALVTQREKELHEARAAMHRLTEMFQETSRSQHPDAHVEVVHGAPNIARLAEHVHERTQFQLRGFDRPPYSERPGSSYPTQQRRIAAGVTYRVIYDSAALAVPGRMYDDVLPSIAGGEQARTRPELPIKMVISDDQLALIPAAVTSQSIDTTFVIHRSPILSALITLFDAEWERATPIPGTRDSTGRQGTPDTETATLLAMLAAGMTDAHIARSLSWSIRTAQRRMRQLMSDLGVTTRFQAGVAARDRGWL
jgi:sugar-specific transcriptional regulator TrmB/DNA-binding CsgD family transcriptional regulator